MDLLPKVHEPAECSRSVNRQLMIFNSQTNVSYKATKARFVAKHLRRWVNCAVEVTVEEPRTVAEQVQEWDQGDQDPQLSDLRVSITGPQQVSIGLEIRTSILNSYMQCKA